MPWRRRPLKREGVFFRAEDFAQQQHARIQGGAWFLAQLSLYLHSHLARPGQATRGVPDGLMRQYDAQVQAGGVIPPRFR